MNKHDLMYVVRFFLSTYWKAAIMKNTRKVLQVMMEECWLMLGECGVRYEKEGLY